MHSLYECTRPGFGANELNVDKDDRSVCNAVAEDDIWVWIECRFDVVAVLECNDTACTAVTEFWLFMISPLELATISGDRGFFSLVTVV